MSNPFIAPDKLSDKVQSGNDKLFVLVTHGLLAASLFTGISGLAGVVVAYVKREEAPDWARSHYTYAIHTFWLSILYAVIGAVLCFVFIGVVLLLVVFVWYVIRCVNAFTYALNEEPIYQPASWWI